MPIKRILLAEDETALRELLASELAAEGFEVTPASDGKEAIELLRSAMKEGVKANEKWDLVLTDYAMPHATGLEVLAEVQRQGIKTPVVIMTGHLHLGLPDWEALGAVATLQKAFRIREAVALIKNIEVKTEARS